MENYTAGEFSVNSPSVITKYNTAFEFEVYDVPGTIELMTKLVPFIIALCVVYICGVFYLPRLMRKREPMDLRTALIFWNFGLAIFSITGFLRQFPEDVGILVNEGIYDVICFPKNHNYATSFWQLMFTLSKIVELGDTIFLVLRKKEIIFLHWFHHATMVFFSWITFIADDPTARRGGIVNFFVHSFMYTYFALRAMDFKFPTWLSKSLTSLQIVQFIFQEAACLYTVALRLNGAPCERPWINDLIIIGGSFAYMALFLRFYKKAYGSRGKDSKKLK